MDNQVLTVWTTGYLPNGAKVSYTLPISNPMNAYAETVAFVGKLLADGMLLAEPGVNEGEHKEQIGYISRRNKKNDDGTTTPVLDLYVNNDRMQYRFLAVYLNTADDVKAFEFVSGVKLSSIPVNPTKAPADRADEDMVMKLVKPITVIYANNPQYDANNDEKKPKRVFVRWDTIGAISQNAVSSNQDSPNFNAGVENAKQPTQAPQNGSALKFDADTITVRRSSSGKRFYLLANTVTNQQATTFNTDLVGRDYADTLTENHPTPGAWTITAHIKSVDEKSWYEIDTMEKAVVVF